MGSKERNDSYQRIIAFSREGFIEDPSGIPTFDLHATQRIVTVFNPCFKIESVQI